jgi:hypothetical protein
MDTHPDTTAAGGVTPARRGTLPDLTPAVRWVADEQIRVLCVAIAIASPLLSLWWVRGVTEATRQGVWAYSVDGAGTIHYGPVRPADARSSLFREILLQAAQAALTRNPSGLSYPEVARRMFVGESWRQLEAEVRSESPERKRRNLYDHPEVEAIEVIDDGPRPRFRVRGFVVRSGAVDGLAYEPAPGEFHLIAEVADQPDALQQGRYPFVIVRHRLTVHWPSQEGAP